MRLLKKIRVFLVILALASVWLSWPALARWNFGAAPADMTFDAYLGSPQSELCPGSCGSGNGQERVSHNAFSYKTHV